MCRTAYLPPPFHDQAPTPPRTIRRRRAPRAHTGSTPPPLTHPIPTTNRPHQFPREMLSSSHPTTTSSTDTARRCPRSAGVHAHDPHRTPRRQAPMMSPPVLSRQLEPRVDLHPQAVVLARQPPAADTLVIARRVGAEVRRARV